MDKHNAVKEQQEIEGVPIQLKILLIIIGASLIGIALKLIGIF